ncbi:ATP-binding protein [Candidatus Sulfurimonas baltica]|uniref:ATP-binding protein n=1 Tax=Candidatus Sulfurimonas baltica TaxID=2740404 RepID=A0A7S7RMG7_9BACT|nr:ATP-binding protein [Candidatus Sulfurimonas baltica]QOY52197.1 ATP-binding protein [Candidatus Sulfurimonas baltica]
MDALEKVVLIKSAKYEYAEVDLDGNSLFIGANGAGKTTLLRAILYFYTADARTLGISSSKKISFSDYYFEYDNSYIVYVYKKNEKFVLVTAYKDVTVKFRFCLLDKLVNIQDIFVVNSAPIDSAKLWIKLKELGILSGVISSGSEYKKILYSKSHKLNYYTLFDAKEYDGFVKTLSNIFINSKVDSEAIKRVIVSSLQIDKKIDIEQIKRHLERFDTLYEDIFRFNKYDTQIKKIIKHIQDYEQTKSYMQDEFSCLVNSKKITLENIQELDKEISEAKVEKTLLDEKQKYENSLFTKRKDKLSNAIAVSRESIKKTEQIKAHYKEQKIDEKISSFSNLSNLESERQRVVSKKEFLTKEHQEIEQNHNNQIQKILNNFEAQKNLLQSTKLNLSIELETKKQILKTKESEETQRVKDSFENKTSNAKDEAHTLDLHLSKFDFELKNIKNRDYIFNDAQKLSQHLKTQKQLEYDISREKANLEAKDKELRITNESFLKQIEHKEQQQIHEKQIIDKDIDSLKKLISPDENSLSFKINANLGQSDKYIHFIKDEILTSDIDVHIKDDSRQIFALDFLDFKVPKNSLETKYEKLKISLEAMLKNYSIQIHEIKNTQKNFENKIYRDKRELIDKIKSFEIQLAGIKNKIITLKEQDSYKRVEFQTNKEKELETIQSNIDKLTKEKELLKQQIQELDSLKIKEISAKKSLFTKELNKLTVEYIKPLEELGLKQKSLEQEKEDATKEQEYLYKEILKNKNIDIQKLQILENKIAELASQIELINSYNVLIIEYKKDKSEYIDKEKENTRELKEATLKLDLLSDEHNQLNSIFTSQQEQIQTTLIQKTSDLTLKQNNIKRVDDFEKSSSFAEYLEWGIKYVSNDELQEIELILNKIDNLATTYRNLQNTIHKATLKVSDLYDNTLHIKTGSSPIDSAYNLQEFYEAKKIDEAKDFLVRNLNQIVKSIVDEYDTLLNSQGQIESLIKKISKLFESINIGVVDSLSLRYSISNNKIIDSFKSIKLENETNKFGYGINLFNDNNNSEVIIKLLKQLVDVIEIEAISKIEFEDSFLLEFRVVENGNDSKFVSSLDNIGSNGTDVLVKSMIYIAMLYILKEKTTKKELLLHVILDEIGILSQRYLKELIEFANAKGIYFVNGAPDEKLIGTYKRVSLISNIDNSSVVQELIVK